MGSGPLSIRHQVLLDDHELVGVEDQPANVRQAVPLTSPLNQYAPEFGAPISASAFRGLMDALRTEAQADVLVLRDAHRAVKDLLAARYGPGWRHDTPWDGTVGPTIGPAEIDDWLDRLSPEPSGRVVT
jgi:hypothetical protein